MYYVKHIILILFLIVFKTTIFYAIPELNHFVDILVTFVVYTGLFLPFLESLGYILILGIVMDCISGGPFGLYITIYFWTIVCLRPFTTVLYLKNIHILQFLLAIAVIFENIVLFMGTSLLKNEIVFSAESVRESAYQLFWTLVIGPYCISFFNFIRMQTTNLFQPK